MTASRLASSLLTRLVDACRVGSSSKIDVAECLAGGVAHDVALLKLVGPHPMRAALQLAERQAHFSVSPAGLADAQQLMLVEKRDDGRATTKEILPVRFSELEDSQLG